MSPIRASGQRGALPPIQKGSGGKYKEENKMAEVKVDGLLLFIGSQKDAIEYSIAYEKKTGNKTTIDTQSGSWVDAYGNSRHGKYF